MPFTPPSADEVTRVLSTLREVNYLDSGGFKAVYKVLIGDHYEALKLINIPSFSGRQDEAEELKNELIGRIAREINLLKSCSAPEIVRLGTIEPHPIRIANLDFVAYSEEFLDGQSLKTLIDRGERPSENDLRLLLISLLKAINQLWSFGIVHRDIKPGNIMQLAEGDRSFVLLDLGVAFSLEETQLTLHPSLIPGTPPYYAPEMLKPNFRANLDFRSDLYCAALTAYEYASGFHPFNRGDGISKTLYRIEKESPKSLKELRGDLSTPLINIIHQMLKKTPVLRPSNFTVLIRQLEASI